MYSEKPCSNPSHSSFLKSQDCEEVLSYMEGHLTFRHICYSDIVMVCLRFLLVDFTQLYNNLITFHISSNSLLYLYNLTAPHSVMHNIHGSYRIIKLQNEQHSKPIQAVYKLQKFVLWKCVNSSFPSLNITMKWLASVLHSWGPKFKLGATDQVCQNASRYSSVPQGKCQNSTINYGIHSLLTDQTITFTI